MAARPLMIVAEEQAIPEGFTVFSATSMKQTAKMLPEAQHGLFSYFLMRGLEGAADDNGDQQITAGERHAYVLGEAEHLRRNPDPPVPGRRRPGPGAVVGGQIPSGAPEPHREAARSIGPT